MLPTTIHSDGVCIHLSLKSDGLTWQLSSQEVGHFTNITLIKSRLVSKSEYYALFTGERTGTRRMNEFCLVFQPVIGRTIGILTLSPLF